MHKLILIASISLATSFADASEYCVDQYNNQITQVNAELGGLIKRQSEIDARIAEIFVKIAQLSSELASEAGKEPLNPGAIQALGNKLPT